MHNLLEPNRQPTFAFGKTQKTILVALLIANFVLIFLLIIDVAIQSPKKIIKPTEQIDIRNSFDKPQKTPSTSKQFLDKIMSCMIEDKNFIPYIDNNQCKYYKLKTVPDTTNNNNQPVDNITADKLISR